jgi:hypothetical protein
MIFYLKIVTSMAVLIVWSASFSQSNAQALKLLAGTQSKTWKLIDVFMKTDPKTSVYQQSGETMTQMKITFFADYTFCYQYPNIKPERLKFVLSPDKKKATIKMGAMTNTLNFISIRAEQLRYSDQYYLYVFEPVAN